MSGPFRDPVSYVPPQIGDWAYVVIDGEPEPLWLRVTSVKYKDEYGKHEFMSRIDGPITFMNRTVSAGDQIFITFWREHVADMLDAR